MADLTPGERPAVERARALVEARQAVGCMDAAVLLAAIDRLLAARWPFDVPMPDGPHDRVVWTVDIVGGPAFPASAAVACRTGAVAAGPAGPVPALLTRLADGLRFAYRRDRPRLTAGEHSVPPIRRDGSHETLTEVDNG